ncbi:metallophosphoesterase [Cryobacterium sp. Hz9]|uniref:metallophosphoesterase family protein n=1 Tax=Cryobacterium sp. Hz9 TaxID=1259167 RepID=UPI001A7E3330|nr:metallophosphoesterase [Cryobacterium sp. Hz9]
MAGNPDSDLVAGARRTLQANRGGRPGCLVYRRRLRRQRLCRRFRPRKKILNEKLDGTTFPYYCIPGNHEIMRTDMANFRSAFGDTSRVVDQNGTRFITLDFSTGRLSGDFTQVQLLRARLDDAAVNLAISGVVVLQHMLINERIVNKASQLASRLDAEMEQDWLEDFREESGKSVAFVFGHVEVFQASRENGISYLINGNSGKTPAGSSFGGFTGGPGWASTRQRERGKRRMRRGLNPTCNRTSTR